MTAQERIEIHVRQMIPGDRRSARGRRSVLACVAGLFAAVAIVVMSLPAHSSAQEESSEAFLDVIEIDGPIDPILRDFVLAALDRAERSDRVDALLLRLNTPGTLGTDGVRLAEAVRDADVPVITWVGAPGADLGGAGILLVAVSQYAGMAQNTRIGPLNPPDLKANVGLDRAEARRLLDELLNTTGNDRSVDAYLRLLDGTLTADEARDAGIVEYLAPTIGEALVGVDGHTVVLGSGEVVTIDTVELLPDEERTERTPGLAPTVITRFWRPTGIQSLLHDINTPTYAYVLLLVGLAAIAFEFYAVSVGIAGIFGGVLVAGGFIAAANLPVNWWAIALLAAAVVLFCADVQLSRLGALTVAGTALAVAGSVFFTYSGIYRVPAWAIALIVGGLLLFFAVAMTTVARTRFSTPTIGRAHLVGTLGKAHSALTPEGLVDISGAIWRGRSHRGRIDAGEGVTVRAVDGLVLEVDQAPGSEKEVQED